MQNKGITMYKKALRRYLNEARDLSNLELTQRDIDHMISHYNKLHSPESVVQKIRNSDTLVLRWLSAMIIGWVTAEDALRNAIKARKLLTDEQLEEYTDRYSSKAVLAKFKFAKIDFDRNALSFRDELPSVFQFVQKNYGSKFEIVYDSAGRPFYNKSFEIARGEGNYWASGKVITIKSADGKLNIKFDIIVSPDDDKIRYVYDNTLLETVNVLKRAIQDLVEDQF